MIYFVSDVHLGLLFGDLTVREREQRFCEFLDHISPNCTELFIVGDLFDFWFEWKSVVPRGFVRTMGRLAAMVERGTVVHFFVGNHDMWIEDYLSTELGVLVHREPLIIDREGKRLYITHSHTMYKHRGFSRFLEVLFTSRRAKWVAQRLFHPGGVVRFGQGWSRSNRLKRGEVSHRFVVENNEWIASAQEILKSEEIDYFVFGHLHSAIIYDLSPRSKMVVLGEWVEHPVYGVMEGSEISLKEW